MVRWLLLACVSLGFTALVSGQTPINPVALLGPNWPVPNNSGVPVEGFEPVRHAERLALDGQVSVFLGTGEVFLERTDVSLRGKGRNLLLRRIHRTQVSYGGAFGWNATHNYDQRVKWQGGQLHHFDGERMAVDVYAAIGGGLYECQTPGVYRKARLENGAWTIRDRDGTLLGFHKLDGSRQAGKLLEDRDRFGNVHTLVYAANGRLSEVRDTLGRPLSFGYESLGRVETITDHVGRITRYAYKGADLQSVTYPAVVGTPVGPDGQANDFPTGKTLTLTHTGGNDPLLAHNVKTVTNPREVANGGGPIVSIAYLADRVDTVTLGTGTFQLSYQVPGATGEAAQTTVVDRKGYTSEYGFDGAGGLLRHERFTQGVHPNDPASFVASYALNAHGERVLEQFPAGDRIESVFDVSSPDHFQRGNERTRRHLPAAGAPGSASELRWTNAFEPIYNQDLGSVQLLTTVLDYQEGLSASTGLATLISDWGIDVGNLPLDLNQDRNGDGVTHQIAGQVIWEQSPTITKGQPTPQQIVIVTTHDDHGRVLTRNSGEGALTVYEYASDANGGLLEALIEDADPTLAPPTLGSSFWTRSVPHVHAVTRYGRDAAGNITSITDPRGVVTTHLVNSHDEVLLTRVADQLAAVADPVLVAIQNRGWTDLAAPGYETWYRYDANGNLVRIDEENRASGVPGNPWITTTQGFDLENRHTAHSREISPAVSAVTTYGYDANGNLELVQHPEGNTETSVFDERDLLFTHTRDASDPAMAATTTHSYDLNARLTVLEGPEDLDGDGLNERTLFSYDGRGRVLSITSPVGTVTTQLYDSSDRDAGHTVWGRPAGPSPTANDTSGNVQLRRIDKRRDEIGREYEIEELVFVPAGQSGSLPYTPGAVAVTRTTRWDRDHLALETRDQNGDLSSFERDGLGRELNWIDGEGNRIERTFDAAGNATQVVSTDVNPIAPSSPEVRTDRFVHDALGRLVRRSDTLGQTSYYAYDGRGNRTAEADARGPLLVDPLGLVPVPINMPGNTRRWIHDGLGRPVQQFADSYPGGVGSGVDLFDPSFSPRHLPAGASGSLSSGFQYDRNGNLEVVTTDGSETLVHDYDELDRLTVKTFPDGSSFVTDHWRNGSVKTHALYDENDALVRSVASTYDGDGRLVAEAVTLPAGSAIEGSLARTWEYNGRGFWTASSDDNGPWLDATVTRLLDSSGMVLQETQNGVSVSRQLDPAGSMTALWYGDGRRVDFEYNANYRLTRITQAGVPIIEYDYFGPERPATLELGNSLVQAYDEPKPGSGDLTGYDAAGVPVHLEHRTAGGGHLTELTHDLDRNKDRVAEHGRVGAGPLVSDLLSRDSQQRLDVFQRNVIGANPPELTQSYQRDGDGNWIDLLIQAAGQAPSLYTFQQGDNWQYDAIAGAALEHDVAGNRTGDQWFHYRYDAFDRLVRVAERLPGGGEGVTLMTFAYDASGRRIEKASGFGTTRYVYEGLSLVEERGSAGQLLAQHVVGNALDEVVQTLRDVDGVAGLEPYYLLRDALGSTIALADGSGAMVERYDYDAYGAPRFLDGNGAPIPGALASAFGNTFLFSGREYDWELASFKSLLAPLGYFSEWTVPVGQYFYRARYMDPSEGRFASRDPLALANNQAGDPLPLLFARLTQGYVEEPYTYVSDNPLDRTDPLGLADSTRMVDGHLVQRLGCIKTEIPKPKTPPRTTPAPTPAPAPKTPQATTPKTPRGGGGGGSKLGGAAKGAGKFLGVANAAASLWAGALTGLFNPKELGKAAGFCTSLWTGGLQALVGIPECPGADDVIIFEGPKDTTPPGGGGGGGGGPSTGGGGSSKPGTCRVRVIHMCTQGGNPGDCLKPRKPTTPGPSGPSAPGPASPGRNNGPSSGPSTGGGGGPSAPGGGAGGGTTPSSTHPKPCTPVPISYVKGDGPRLVYQKSCADAVAAGMNCGGDENEVGGEIEEKEPEQKQQVRADWPGRRAPQLATFLAERGAHATRVVWSPARGQSGHYSLVRIDQATGQEELLASHQPFEADRVLSHDDPAGADSSSYLLIVHDRDGEWAFGPVASRSALPAAAQVALADEQDEPADRRPPLPWRILLGVLSLGASARALRD